MSLKNRLRWDLLLICGLAVMGTGGLAQAQVPITPQGLPINDPLLEGPSHQTAWYVFNGMQWRGLPAGVPLGVYLTEGSQPSDVVYIFNDMAGAHVVFLSDDEPLPGVEGPGPLPPSPAPVPPPPFIPGDPTNVPETAANSTATLPPLELVLLTGQRMGVVITFSSDLPIGPQSSFSDQISIKRGPKHRRLGGLPGPGIPECLPEIPGDQYDWFVIDNLKWGAGQEGTYQLTEPLIVPVVVSDLLYLVNVGGVANIVFLSDDDNRNLPNPPDVPPPPTGNPIPLPEPIAIIVASGTNIDTGIATAVRITAESDDEFPLVGNNSDCLTLVEDPATETKTSTWGRIKTLYR